MIGEPIMPVSEYKQRKEKEEWKKQEDREFSDKRMIQGGANLNADGELVATQIQKESAREEMEEDIVSEFKYEFSDRKKTEDEQIALFKNRKFASRQWDQYDHNGSLERFIRQCAHSERVVAEIMKLIEDDIVDEDAPRWSPEDLVALKAEREEDMQKKRMISDIEMTANGARRNEKGEIIATQEQKLVAQKEMESDIELKYIEDFMEGFKGARTAGEQIAVFEGRKFDAQTWVKYRGQELQSFINANAISAQVIETAMINAIRSEGKNKEIINFEDVNLFEDFIRGKNAVYLCTPFLGQKGSHDTADDILFDDMGKSLRPAFDMEYGVRYRDYNHHELLMAIRYKKLVKFHGMVWILDEQE